MDPIAVAAGWLVARLRADTEAGLWSALRGLVFGDPLTVALERVTQEALCAAVRSTPGGADLPPDGLKRVLEVLGNVWSAIEVHRAAGDSLLGRLQAITSEAMERCTEPVPLGDEPEAVSVLSVLNRDHGLQLQPNRFGLEVAYCWQRGVRDAAVTNPVLVPLAAELRDEIGHELVDTTREELLAAVGRLARGEQVREGFEAVSRQLGEIRDDLRSHVGSRGGRAGAFPQFVGVPDRNPAFVGRAEELDELSDAIERAAGTIVVTQVAAGLGGVGKTALAVELCHHRRGSVDVVRWLPAEGRDALTTAYVGMGPALGLDLDGLGVDDAVARIRAWFETTGRSWLLVFDNVEAPDVLDGLVPLAGRGQVLVTSRYRDWSRLNTQVLRVGVLGTDDAVALLTRLTGREGDAGARSLVTWLGGLALAVEQAAAFCRQTGWSYVDYQQHLERRADELLARNPAALRRLPGREGQDMVVLTVWDKSLERAATEAEGAPHVLGVLSYFGAEQIPRALLAGPVAADEALLRGGDRLYVDEALAALAHYSLVELHRARAGDAILSVSLHRLVQEITRLAHTDQQACATAVRLLLRSWPEHTQEPDTWTVCRLLEPHLAAVTRHAEAQGVELAAASWLLDRYGRYLRYAVNPTTALVHTRRAVELYARLASSDDVAALSRRVSLADSYARAGRPTDAVALLEPVVADLERLRGPHHHDTITARANLANSYGASGRIPEAIALLERVATDREHSLGHRHRDTVTARANLADWYRLVGRVPEAVALLEAAVADFERLLDHRHRDTLTARRNLAAAYHAAGRVTEAIALQEQLLADHEHVLGHQHLNTHNLRNDLAVSYESAGEAQKALALLEPVLPDLEHALGRRHPVAIVARAIVASCYQAVGRIAEAIALQEQLVADCEDALGDRHPDTLSARVRLAVSYESAGRLLESRALLEPVLPDLERLLRQPPPNAT